MVGTSINLFSLLSKLTIIEVKKTFMSFLKFSELKLSTLNKKWIFFWVNEIQNYLLISSQVFDVWNSQIKCLSSHKIRVSKACWRNHKYYDCLFEKLFINSSIPLWKIWVVKLIKWSSSYNLWHMILIRKVASSL